VAPYGIMFRNKSIPTFILRQVSKFLNIENDRSTRIKIIAQKPLCVQTYDDRPIKYTQSFCGRTKIVIF